MFFSKKSHTGTQEESVAKKSVKKIDTLVTGMILGGIVASIYGVKKIKERSEKSEESTHSHDTHMLPQHTDNHGEDRKKRGILSRIFLGNN